MQIDKTQLLMAEQQITGFAHATQGFSLPQLLTSMGLTRDEWDAICANDGLHLPKNIIDEINQYFSA